MLSREIVATLCSNYGLGTITQIDLAAGGIENLNYFIDLRHNNTLNSYVLTVVKTPSYSGDAYFDMMGKKRAMIKSIKSLPIGWSTQLMEQRTI